MGRRDRKWQGGGRNQIGAAVATGEALADDLRAEAESGSAAHAAELRDMPLKVGV